MILIWGDNRLGEISAPTVKEMRMVKRELGIRNPITFMDRATKMMIDRPVIGYDGEPERDADGKIRMEPSASEEFDIDAFAMLIAIMLTRSGKPTDYEQVDGDIATDFRIELSEEEKAQLVEEGKAEAVPPVPADAEQMPICAATT